MRTHSLAEGCTVIQDALSELPTAAPPRPRVVVIEKRKLLVNFLQTWLGNKLGYDLTFFESWEELVACPRKPELVLAAASLLPHPSDKNMLGAAPYLAVYSEHFTPSCVVCWKKNGAHGLLDFRDGESEWEQCLTQILNGRKALTRTAHFELQRAEQSQVGLLTTRELEVAEQFLKGFSARQVSAVLGTTEGTIKNQRKSIYRKLGIVRATQLAHAVDRGIPRSANGVGSAA